MRLAVGVAWIVLVTSPLALAGFQRAQAPVSRASVVSIPAGSFWMGTDERELPALMARYRITRTEVFSSEVPRRAARVEAFRLDRTEVTNAAFAAFLRADPAWRKGALPNDAHNGRYLADWDGEQFPIAEGARPVRYVTWPAAVAYCIWVGGRLPTEAEWEYAARGGLMDPEFPWGDALPEATRANWSGTKLDRPDDVGKYEPNGYGLYDMAGNVWEFVADRWAGRDAVVRYVIRGGSYGGAPANLRVRYRDSHPSGDAGPHVGFRCAYGEERTSR